MRFAQHFLDEIRARVSVSSVIGRTVQWDKRKTNAGKGDYWACCPFHGEKTPSFHCEDRKGRYHCFGCKESGDVFTYLVQKEGLPFPEAVERLAAEAGLEMPKATPEQAAREERRATLHEVMEMATGYFESQLAGPAGREGLEYLKMRGLSAETIAEFRLGYAGSNRRGLLEFLKAKGVDEKAMADAGLIIVPDAGGAAFDRFRERIMFPIQDRRAQVIAFGGRAMSSGAMAKYLNSPETSLFDKSSVLFNLHRARKPAFETSKLIVVEGYMDVIAMHQAGIAYTVAALGTALTENHLRELWRVAADPILCFDGDAAGQMAASRAADRAIAALDSGNAVRLITLPENKDPADLIAAGQTNYLKRLLDNSVSLQDFIWSRETSGLKLDTPEARVRLEQKIQEVVQSIPGDSVRKHYQLSYRILLSDLFWRTSRKSVSRSGGKAAPTLSLPEPMRELEALMLGLAVEFPENVYDNALDFERWDFRYEDFARFHRELIRLIIAHKSKSISELYHDMSPTFYAVLEDVHGSRISTETRLAGGEVREVVIKQLGHRLYSKCPVARYNPDGDFVHNYLELLSGLKDLRAVEIERDETLQRFDNGDAAAQFDRLEALQADIARLKADIGRQEAELNDRAVQLREAYLVSDAEGQASVSVRGAA